MGHASVSSHDSGAILSEDERVDKLLLAINTLPPYYPFTRIAAGVDVASKAGPVRAHGTASSQARYERE